MIETIEKPETKPTEKVKTGGLMSRVMTVALTTVMGVSATVGSASAEINSTTFDPIVNLIDAVIPMFTSILDLIIAVFPLVIAMAFLGGLAALISKIFDGTLDLGKFSKK